MKFKKIDKSNYWDCISLTVDGSQEGFVADNKQSLVEAVYEDDCILWESTTKKQWWDLFFMTTMIPSLAGL